MHFNATRETLPEILAWVHQKIADAGLSRKRAMQFELCLEEAIVNVVMHGYAERGGSLEIEAVLTPNEALTFTLIDQGSPFDPTTAPLKDPAPPDQVVEGGLGVKYMRLYCDGQKYERREGCNVLTLSISFSQ